MHYVIDGNNIIKHKLWQSGKKTLDDRHALIIFLKAYLRHHPSVKFTVVFDGWSDTSLSSQNIKVVWSYDDTADSVIIKKIPSSGRDTTIVSNDNEIRKKAKLAGLRTLKVEQFIDIMEQKKANKKKDIEDKAIPYNRVPEIRNELEKYYEKNPPSDRIRKIRKRIQRLF
ncbi:MAG: NYN domain-containing protein [Candidatus Omnitrophica bacterium]|nr:NYN domain-containing protein [Candidatus Omnitrophota bacterium]MCM8825037.1 NYN domain-containing protein [Candidatus Omnitrophota bacterium]